MPKFSVEFEGFNEVMARLSKLEADTKQIAEKALKESHAYVTPKLQSDMQPHKRMGRTQGSIQTGSNIKWSGQLASVDVGFNIRNGGLPSIFLMYGTQSHAASNQYGSSGKINGGVAKDNNLYNDVYGSSTVNKIREIQRDIFYEALRELE